MDTEVPFKPIPSDYCIDPETETTLSDGTQLCEGMIVVIANPALRWDLNRKRGYIRWGRETAHWCRVTELELHPIIRFGKVVDHKLTFVGVYADDVGRPRTYNTARDGWHVKLSSIPSTSVASASDDESSLV